MKTSTPKALLTIIVLLATGAISYAQPNAVSYQKPKDSAPNIYIEAGGGLMYIQAGKDSDNESVDALVYGGGASIGWRISKKHKIQISAGTYSSSISDTEESYEYDHALNMGVISVETLDEKVRAMPVLLSYSYCIPLSSTERYELRLTPAIGFLSLKYDATDVVYDNGVLAYEKHVSNSSRALAVWAGVGFTCHFSRRLYMDIGYRYLRTSRPEYELSGEDESPLPSSSVNTHQASISLGWKF